MKGAAFEGVTLSHFVLGAFGFGYIGFQPLIQIVRVKTGDVYDVPLVTCGIGQLEELHTKLSCAGKEHQSNT